MITQSRFIVFKDRSLELVTTVNSLLMLLCIIIVTVRNYYYKDEDEERCLSQMDSDSAAYPKVCKQDAADDEISVSYIASWIPMLASLLLSVMLNLIIMVSLSFNYVYCTRVT